MESKAVRGALAPAFDCPTFSDITVVVKDGKEQLEIKSHRAVLWARLPRFRNLKSSNTSSSSASSSASETKFVIETNIPAAWKKLAKKWRYGGMSKSEAKRRWLEIHREVIR
jgi:hypothetical protein